MSDPLITDRLRRLPESVEPDAGFAEALRRRLAEELANPDRTRIDGDAIVISSIAPSPRRRPPSWKVVGFAAAATVLLVVTVALLSRPENDGGLDPIAPSPSPSTTPSPTTTSPTSTTPTGSDPALEPVPPVRTEPLVETVGIDDGGNVYGVAADDRHLWALSLQGDLTRLDPETLEVTGHRLLAESSDIATGGGTLWFADVLTGDVLAIDPDTMETVGTIRTGFELQDDVFRPVGVPMLGGARRTFARMGGIDADATSVWVGDHAGAVIEYDPVTLEEARRIPVGLRPDIVRVSDHYVLVGAHDDDAVEVYNRRDGTLAVRFDDIESLRGADVDAFAAYVHDGATGVVTRIDPITGRLLRNEELEPPAEFIGLPIHSAGPVVSADALFVDTGDGVVVLDPNLLELVDRVELSGGGGNATVTPDGSAWIARYTTRSVNRITPAS